MVISEKDLAELALNGLRSHIKEKLEGYEFLTVNQVLQRALAQKSRSKDAKFEPNRLSMHVLQGESSDDEGNEVYAAEFVWSSNDKPSTCASLKPIPKIGMMRLNSLLMCLSVIGFLMSWQSLGKLSSLILFHQRIS